MEGWEYSQTSEQRTLWEQYKFKSFVLCREVLFSEVHNVLEPLANQLFGTLKSVLCREVYYIVSLSRRVHYRRFDCRRRTRSISCNTPRGSSVVDYSVASHDLFKLIAYFNIGEISSLHVRPSPLDYKI